MSVEGDRKQVGNIIIGSFELGGLIQCFECPSCAAYCMKTLQYKMKNNIKVVKCFIFGKILNIKLLEQK